MYFFKADQGLSDLKQSCELARISVYFLLSPLSNLFYYDSINAEILVFDNFNSYQRMDKVSEALKKKCQDNTST